MRKQNGTFIFRNMRWF